MVHWARDTFGTAAIVVLMLLCNRAAFAAEGPAPDAVQVQYAQGDAQTAKLAVAEPFFANSTSPISGLPAEVVGLSFTRRSDGKATEATVEIDAPAGSSVYLLIVDDGKHADGLARLADSGWVRLSDGAFTGANDVGILAIYQQAFVAAKQVAVTNAGPAVSVAAQKISLRAAGSVGVSATAAPTTMNSTADNTAAPALHGTMHISLPASVDSTCVGGGGRYLLLQMKKLQQIAVFDTAQRKVLKYLPMPTNDLVFSAGAEKLFVGLIDRNQIQRWDLKTFTMELSVFAPEGGVSGIAIGADAVGPVMLIGKKRYWQLDPVTLAAKPVPSKNWGTDGSAWGPTHVHVSFDGSTAIANGGGWAGIELALIADGGVSAVRAGGYALEDTLISGDGSLVFPEGSKIVRNDLSSSVTGLDGQVFAADDATFSLAYKDSALTLFSNSDPRPLLVVRDLPELAQNVNVPISQRVHLSVANKELITLGAGGQELIVRPFDLAEQLAAGGTTYLFVESSPIRAAKCGAVYSYAMQILSKAGSVHTELQAGPAGMTVDNSGNVRWSVPTDFAEATPTVIIKISDASGQSIFQTYSINVGDVHPAVASVVNPASPGELAVATPSAPGQIAVAAPPPAVLARDDAHRIQVPGNYKYLTGLAGHALILAGNQLAILAPDGYSIQKKITLPKKYVNIGERPDYYVALCQDPRAIDTIDKKTLKVIQSRPIAFDELVDLALNPTVTVSYVSYIQRSDLPMHHYLIFNETSAQALTDDNFIGQWLAMAPDGRFMMAGFQESFQAGNDIIDNPDHIWIVPKIGYINSLVRYDLDPDTGLPVNVAHRESVGGNGVGIRLSPDGKRATYLSHTGYPEMSNNLGGWDALNLSLLPVSYATKDIASTQDIAYHPILPIVACYGKGSVVFFDRETGEKLDSRIDDSAIASDDISRVYFSPDGKSLLLETTFNSIKYLHHLPLTLSAAELKLVNTLPRPDEKVQPPHDPDVPRSQQKLQEKEA